MSDFCVIIPTYNNAKTLVGVIEETLKIGYPVIVVNDGSTDATPDLLNGFGNAISVLSYEDNRGKGHALLTGFKKAFELEYKNAITIDSDGQHLPSDIPKLVAKAQEKEGCVVMGSRDLVAAGAPGKSSFGNKFSNFWFWAETAIKLPDTQTGFRIYPLKPLLNRKYLTKGFAFEIESIVKLAWSEVLFEPVAIDVSYPEDRISHFKPFKDFFKISVLNSWLFLLAVFFYHPRRWLRTVARKGLWNIVRDDVMRDDQTIFRKAISCGIGVLIGVAPIWGFQLILGVPLAGLLRLNKTLFFLSVNISLPPAIPLIVYGSYQFGSIFISNPIDLDKVERFNLSSIWIDFQQYLVGSLTLGLALMIVTTFVAYVMFAIFMRNGKSIKPV